MELKGLSVNADSWAGLAAVTGTGKRWVDQQHFVVLSHLKGERSSRIEKRPDLQNQRMPFWGRLGFQSSASEVPLITELFFDFEKLVGMSQACDEEGSLPPYPSPISS